VDDTSVAVVLDEIKNAGRNQYERAMIVAEVHDLLRAALDGRVIPIEQVKKIERWPCGL
jgi:hypothetical protein